MVEKLQARVRQLKAENGQLEELVHAAEQKAGDAAVQVLEQRVQKLQRVQAREAEAAQAAAAVDAAASGASELMAAKLRAAKLAATKKVPRTAAKKATGEEKESLAEAAVKESMQAEQAGIEFLE